MTQEWRAIQSVLPPKVGDYATSKKQLGHKRGRPTLKNDEQLRFGHLQALVVNAAGAIESVAHDGERRVGGPIEYRF